MAYTVSSGVIQAPVKVVLYGPEGIGKSTFASQFPSPIFIDTEGGTKKLNVQRLPQPTSWTMLLDEVKEVRLGHIPCKTLVIDTADWAERMCIRSICDKAKVSGIEDFGYGKGYTYAKEEFGRLLDELEDVINAGINVVITAHAQLTKFEQPDEMGQYDRWAMKTSKQVAPLLREWCDMLLFANYKTFVVKDGDGKMAKSKAQGGKRVMYTTHHACWDAKNRDGLPDEMPFEYSGIASVIPASASSAPSSSVQIHAAVAHPPKSVEDAPAQQTLPKKSDVTETPKTTSPAEKALADAGIPKALCSLMAANNVSPTELQQVVGERGYFPPDMPISDYPEDFITGCLVNAWAQVFGLILANRKVPF